MGPIEVRTLEPDAGNADVGKCICTISATGANFSLLPFFVFLLTAGGEFSFFCTRLINKKGEVNNEKRH